MTGEEAGDRQMIGADVMLWMQQHRAADHAQTFSIMECYRREAARLRAELAAVREQVSETLSGPWMPTPYAVTVAMYPSREAIMRQMSSKDADEWSDGS